MARSFHQTTDPRVKPAGDAVLEQWLRDEVIPGHQEYLAGPSRAIPVDEILPRIKARRVLVAHFAHPAGVETWGPSS